MIFSFCFSKNLKIQIVFFQMIHYFEHYFNIYISTSMDQILWNAFHGPNTVECPVRVSGYYLSRVRPDGVRLGKHPPNPIKLDYSAAYLAS